jgi:hypothetical protein
MPEPESAVQLEMEDLPSAGEYQTYRHHGGDWKAMNSGAPLLSDLYRYFTRYVVMSPEEAVVLALETLHTHAIDAAEFTPYLHISSPVLRCGKTTLLDLLSLIVADPWMTGHVTAAALVRKIDQDQPTLLLDESDATFHANSEYSQALRGMLDTGYERGGTYSICVRVGGDWVSKDFSTFCPKIIAGIGRLPDTVEDRSIPMRLRRKLPTDSCGRFRKRTALFQAEALRCKSALWAKRHRRELADAVPDMPSELNDRQRDVCEPLIAIADCAGGEWPEKARQGLVTLLASRPRRDDSQAVVLLADIKACFDNHDALRMRSKSLVDALVAHEDSSWRECNKGGRLSQAGLARLLAPFDIEPRDIRFENGIFKGYRRKDFEDAWARYLPAPRRRP